MTTKRYLVSYSAFAIVCLTMNLENDLIAFALLIFSTLIFFAAGIIYKSKLVGPEALIVVIVSLTTLSLMNRTNDFLEQKTIKEGNRIISALDQYRKTNQTFPDSLKQLRPDYFKEIPTVANSLFNRNFYYQKISESNYSIRFSASGFMFFEYNNQTGSWSKLD